MSLTIWCNSALTEPAERLLVSGLADHRLVFAKKRSASVLVAGPSDSGLEKTDVVFGQPEADDCLRSKRIKWVAVTSAGYGRYETPEFLETFRARGSVFTSSSTVFAEPCAQHVLAMMLALGRQLLASHAEQLGGRQWKFFERRSVSVLLNGQTVLLLGYGKIARRLTELLVLQHRSRHYGRRTCARSGVGKWTLGRGVFGRVRGGAAAAVERVVDGTKLLHHAAHGGRTQRSGRRVGEALSGQSRRFRKWRRCDGRSRGVRLISLPCAGDADTAPHLRFFCANPVC